MLGELQAAGGREAFVLHIAWCRDPRVPEPRELQRPERSGRAGTVFGHDGVRVVLRDTSRPCALSDVASTVMVMLVPWPARRASLTAWI